MVALTTLVLKDHAGADVTFSPRGFTAPGVATTVNSAGVPIGEKLASFSISRTTQSGKRKVSLKLVLPIVQDVTYNGVTKPTVIRTAYANLDISFDSTSSTVERQDMLAAVKALFADTGQIKPLIEDLSEPF